MLKNCVDKKLVESSNHNLKDGVHYAYHSLLFGIIPKHLPLKLFGGQPNRIPPLFFIFFITWYPGQLMHACILNYSGIPKLTTRQTCSDPNNFLLVVRIKYANSEYKACHAPTRFTPWDLGWRHNF